MPDVKPLLDRFETLSNRGVWNRHWEDVAEVMLPQRAEFVTRRQPGEKRTENIYDGTPLLAVRGLAAAIDSMVKPKTTSWFAVKPEDDELEDDDEVKAWLEAVEKETFAAIYHRDAQFIRRSGEVDKSLAAFGNGVLFTAEHPSRNGVLFRSFSLTNSYIAESESGIVDTIFICAELTARQAAQRWGRDNLGDKTKELLREDGQRSRKDEKQKFLWAVQPRRDRDPRMLDARQMAFSSHVVDIDSEHMVQEGGFPEFPFAIPRWDTQSGEVYGWGPGMLALPDTRTLQAQAKALLRGGQLAVDPILIAPDDGTIKAAQLFPGGVVSYNAKHAARLGPGRKPVDTLDISGNLPFGRDMQQDSREQIFAAFFRNVLNLPVDGPAMTATEVIERKEEFVRTVGPVFGQLENDYVGPIAERVFNILMRQGRFPVPPERLQGRGVRFEYANPVEKVRRQIETLGAARTIEMIAPFVQADPSVMDNFDGDEIARDAGEFNGMPRKWIRAQDDVDRIRENRAAAQAREQELQETERVVQSAAGVAQAAQ